MAATEFVFLQGKCKWAQLIRPDTRFDDKGKWNLTLYPNEKSLEKIRELQAQGVKNKLKKDEDGYNIAFHRPVEMMTKSGKRMGFDPPIILDKDNQPMSDPPLIGNGSDVTIKLEVYQHGIPGSSNKAKAARLLAVKIDHLIPFERNVIIDPGAGDARAVKGMDQQPEQLF
jgi:hypothetical protein